MTFFIADLHFGHGNCLVYDKSDFKSIEEHDEALIKNWNEVVGIEDDVWILGDFSWYNATKTIEILSRLNGNKYLCRGNHDKKLLRNANVRAMFVEIEDYKELQITNKIGIVMSHYPIPCFNHHFNKWIHLYGHVHNTFEWEMMKEDKEKMEMQYHIPCRMYNVGCMIDGMGYTPRTLEEILAFNEGSYDIDPCVCTDDEESLRIG